MGQRNHARIGRSGMLLVALASLLLVGTSVHDGIRPLTDPAATITHRLRLPGGRLLWLNTRPARSPALSPMVGQYEGRIDDPRLIIQDYPPAAGPVEHTIRLPQR